MANKEQDAAAASLTTGARPIASQVLVNLAAALWLILLIALPAVVDPDGAHAVEPAKASLLRATTALIVACWVASRLLAPSARSSMAMHPIVRAGLVFLAVTALSTALSPDPPKSLFGSAVRSMGLLNVAAGVALVIVGSDLLATRSTRELLLSALLAGALFPCGYALAQLLGLDPLSWTGVTGLVSTLGSPTFLGGYLVLVIPFALYRLVATGRTVLAGSGFWSSLGYALSLVLVLVASAVVAKAAIRAAMLGLAVEVGLFAVLLGLHVRGPRRWLAPLAAALLLALTMVLSLAVGNWRGLDLFLRFMDVGAPSGSAAERLWIWRWGLLTPLENPVRALVGFGPEMQFAAFEHVEAIVRMPGNLLWDRAHNLLLDTWIQGGLLGVAALLILLVAASTTCWRVLHSSSWPESILAAALLAGLAGHVVEQAFAFQTVVTATWFWLLLAFIAALPVQPAREQFATQMPVPTRRGLAALTLAAAVLGLPVLAAPAIADHLQGAADAASRGRQQQAAVSIAREAATWAPWLGDPARMAAASLDNLAAGAGTPRRESLLQQEEAWLEEAARRDPLDGFTSLLLARRRLAWATRSPLPDDAASLLARAEAACQRALATAPFRYLVWEVCADVSEARGQANEADARRERARLMKPE